MPTAILDRLEKFVHVMHGGDRWTLFKKDQRGANLPPTRSVLAQHVARANYSAHVVKNFGEPCPVIPEPVGYGWHMNGDFLVPTISNSPPAPEAVMDLIKCNCTREVCKGACKCAKNNLPCTVYCNCKCEHSDSVPHTADLSDDLDDEF